jgi:hypothetical protein
MQQASREAHKKAKERFAERIIETLRAKYAEDANSDAPFGWESPSIRVPKLLGTNTVVAAAIHKWWGLYDCKPVRKRSIVLQRANSCKAEKYVPDFHWFSWDVGEPLEKIQKKMRQNRAESEMKIIEEQFAQGQREITLPFAPCQSTLKNLKNIGWKSTDCEGGDIISVAPLMH